MASINKNSKPKQEKNHTYKTLISSCFFPLSRHIRRQYNTNWHKDPGCKHQPLFRIPLDHVIVEELHLMLRVTDRLEEGLIYEMLDWDEVLKNE